MIKSVLPPLLVLMCSLGWAGEPGACLVEAAREQVGVTTHYDGSYRQLAYPGGDLPLERGVCTDVIVRAYRKNGIDLQQRVHEDMQEAWAAYPKLWGLSHPDTNIDHRRVPNLVTFFQRNGEKLSIAGDPKIYLPGDLVIWRLTSGVPHIGIVSDRRTSAGTPLVIHNIGWGAQEEDILFRFTITGHFRFFPASFSEACRAKNERK